MTKLTEQQVRDLHGKAIARRRAINGQPNGYRPISEAELQAEKQARHIAQFSRLKVATVDELDRLVERLENGEIIDA